MMTWSCKIKKKQIQELAITPRYHVELGARSDSQRQRTWGSWGEESRVRDGSSGQKPHSLQKNGAQVTWTACYLRKKILHGIASFPGTSCHWPIVSSANHDFKTSNHRKESCSTVQQSGNAEVNFRQGSQYFSKCPCIPLKEVTRCPWLLTQMLKFPWWTICVIPLLWGPWVFVKCHDVLCSRCDLLL